MSHLLVHARRTTFPILVVLCLAALSVSYAFADEAKRPLATQVIGDPDAAVTGKFAVGTATPGNKALTVVGVIDFLGAGTVHNYFTQGTGNNMQINTNVDEANTVVDAARSQWKLVLGSSLDQFSIRRSPAGATYNEDALFFINSSGSVGIAKVDTNNGAAIDFNFSEARLSVLGGNLHITAIKGYSTLTSGAGIGVEGVADSTYIATGVKGIASSDTATTSHGVYGISFSSSGDGVHGTAMATSGSTHGVYGRSYSPDGYGVFGYASDTTGINVGVAGSTASPLGTGVYGFASTSGEAVYGFNTSTLGWAGYFYGDLGVSRDLHVSGTLYKAAGGFQIDHPLDPDKYLNHSFVESPDMMNIYNGVVTLDENGQAWVELPEWFEALNQDFRYQLTPIGEFAPLYIAQRIEDNRFQIAGGAAGMEVSWQVTGIRHDAYAEAHRIPVEEDKPASEVSRAEPPAVPQVLADPALSLPDPY